MTDTRNTSRPTVDGDSVPLARSQADRIRDALADHLGIDLAHAVTFLADHTAGDPQVHVAVTLVYQVPVEEYADLVRKAMA